MVLQGYCTVFFMEVSKQTKQCSVFMEHPWLRGSVVVHWCFQGAFHGDPWDSPWCFRGTFMVHVVHPWCFHGSSMVMIQWNFHDAATILSWSAIGTFMVPPCYFRGASTVLPSCFHGTSMRRSWCFHCTPMVYALPRGLSLCIHGASMGTFVVHP